MEQYLNILTHSPLFSNMDGDEILSVLQCLTAHVKTYKKGSFYSIPGITPMQSVLCWKAVSRS